MNWEEVSKGKVTCEPPDVSEDAFETK